MCSLPNKKDLTRGAEILKYRPAVYNRKAKEKFVYFYVLDPQSMIDGKPKLKRIRKKFNLHSSAKANDEEAIRYMMEVNRKLETGWNPLIETNTHKSFVLTDDVFELYKKYLKKLLKDDVIREKTYIDYCSRLKILREYVSQHDIHYIYMWNNVYIDGFLEYIYVDKDLSARTRNNYLLFLSSMSSWMLENGYITSNPCKMIKFLRNKEKKRKALKEKDREKLFNYLERTDPYFLLACKFHYYTLVRPKEMSEIRIKDISIAERRVYISGEISKNRKEGVATLPDILVKLMIDLHVLEEPSTFYLFSNKFRPGEKKKGSRQFTDKWTRVRAEMNFPESYQFYSLKDTGITDIINKVGLNIAKDQARHSSVVVTNAYASKDQLKAHPELFGFE